MKKIFTLTTCLLIFAACAQKSQKVPDANAEGTVIAWIEDKPGGTLQPHDLYPDVPDSLWQALGLKDGVPSSMSCLLLNTEGKNILLDAGLGAPFSQLIPKLNELGVSPDSLQLIYITHLHPDHIGGLLSDGKAVFPRAHVYINRMEAETWQAMEGDNSKLAKAVMATYKERLHLFEAGDTLEGGVKAIAAYGHTPGHTVFQKDSILVIADLIHGAALQLSHPEYCPRYDMDPDAARESRLRILQYARENNLTMYGMHLPAPGSIK
ncbi:MAG: MBL fold metallo-hydrolase [Muribaculaceae bacterium]